LPKQRSRSAFDLVPKPFGAKAVLTIAIARGLAGQPWLVLNHRTGNVDIAERANDLVTDTSQITHMFRIAERLQNVVTSGYT
jgi:hypothetical protein